MISDKIYIPYYSTKGKPPTIVSPKNDYHWQSDRTSINFSWIYNNSDIQQQYQIQIFDIDITEESIPDEWITTADEDFLSERRVYNLVGSGTSQSSVLDLSAVLPDDGSYLWRIRTAGTVSTEWSNWTIDGRVQLDESSPVILNVAAESPEVDGNNQINKWSSRISDLGMPRIRTARTSSTELILNGDLSSSDNWQINSISGFFGGTTSISAGELIFSQPGSGSLITQIIETLIPKTEYTVSFTVSSAIFSSSYDNIFKIVLGGSTKTFKQNGLISGTTYEFKLTTKDDYDFDRKFSIEILSDINATINIDNVSVKRTIFDYGVDRIGGPRCHIYYDYRDCSLNIRAQTGEDTRRYYGLLSFQHIASGNHITSKPVYYTDQVVKAAYACGIEKDVDIGPADMIGSDLYATSSMDEYVYTSGTKLNENDPDTKYIPKGFPSFWQSDVYGQSFPDPSNPLIKSIKTSAYYSLFPVNTRRLSGINRTYDFSNVSGDNGPDNQPNLVLGTSDEFIEMFYPAPYDNVIIIFNAQMNEILAFGRVNKTSTTLSVEPTDDNLTFVMEAGVNVEYFRSNDDLQDIKDTYFWRNDDLTKNNFPRSIMLFFNVYGDSGKDSFIKFYLNPTIYESEEDKKIFQDATQISKLFNGNASGNPIFKTIPYFEIIMSPDADFSFDDESGTMGENENGDKININEVRIGKGAIPPSALSMYENPASNKKIPKNYKFFPFEDNSSVNVSAWGNNETEFTNDPTKYNGSFRISMPIYEFVPYYHPGCVNRLNGSGDNNPIPNIYDADPNPSSDGEIGWSSININTTDNYNGNIQSLPQFNLIYPGDYIQFMNTSAIYGQINPYIYDFVAMITSDDFKGKISRINRFGKSKGLSAYQGFGYFMIEDGWEYDPQGIYPSYNFIDSGIYGIEDIFSEFIGDINELNLISNGDFSSDSNWTISSGWSIIGGVLTLTSSSASMSQPITSLAAERRYLLRYEITDYLIPATYKIIIGGTEHIISETSAGQYEHVITTPSSGSLVQTIVITANSSGSGGIEIDNIELFSLSDRKSKIVLQNFDNRLFRRSAEITLSSNVSSDTEFTNEISLLDGNIFKEAINGESSPVWIYELDDNSSTIEPLIISNDTTVQGLFGTLSRNSRWLIETSNIFGGTDFIQKSANSSIQSSWIKRTMFSDAENRNYTIKGPIENFDWTASGSGISHRFSGDQFAIGNIFGLVEPTGEENSVKFFIDVDESTSGIKSVKTYQVNLSTDYIDCSKYFDSNDSVGNLEKVPIVMQRINNATFTSDKDSIETALSKIKVSRSPMDLIEYYFNNKINSWSSASSLENPEEYINLGITGTGYRLIFVKVKDKSGNESNIACAPLLIRGDSTLLNDKPIVHCNASVDDGDIIKASTTVTVNGNDYTFYSNVISRDKEKSRSIVFRKPLRAQTPSSAITSYEDIEKFNDVLLGLSDDLGLRFNIMSPYGAMQKWRFTRPIVLFSKSFFSQIREIEPEWYFDPNDVRHYTPDTPLEYTLGVGQYNNGKTDGFSVNGDFHVPANASLSAITLLGFMDESKSGKSNPIANKIYQFKEEFIGKKLILGVDLSLSFTILHIFRSSNLLTVNRFNGDSTSPSKTIDGDKRRKVWVMVDDPNGICAMIASRRHQHFEKNSDTRKNTGKKDSNGDYVENNMTTVFGYPAVEDLPEDILDTVNTALGITDTQLEPTSVGLGSNLIYFSPSEPITTSSDIVTNEGWMSQIFLAFSSTSNSSEQSILENLTNNQFYGLKVYNKFVFGETQEVTADISGLSYSSGGETYLILENGFVDTTMVDFTGTLGYEIFDKNDLTTPIDLSDIDKKIVRISSNGKMAVVSGELINSLIDPSINEYQLKITINPLDSTALNGLELSNGWWPQIEGIPIPPLGYAPNSFDLNDSSVSDSVRFAVIMNGSFYISDSGYYKFEIDTNNTSYSDFSIDFMTSGKVYGPVESFDGSSRSYSSVAVGGTFKKSDSKSNRTFYLRKGWHIGRFRYITTDNPAEKKIAVIRYMKSDWTSGSTDYYLPIIGAYSENYIFLARAYRTIHGRIIDANYNRYPSSTVDSTKEGQFFRAILGFIDPVEDTLTGTLVKQVALIEKEYPKVVLYADLDNDPSSICAGEVSKQTLSESLGITYAGQMLEETEAIYESGIFDGGNSFRFWRTISWSPDEGEQPPNTSVELYVKSAKTEEGILEKTWNTIVQNGQEKYLGPFTISGSDILQFSKDHIENDEEPNRYIQFRMILKSRAADVTPSINDVTITYSKENSVNFFTTTFNLSSNITRALIAYNGETPTSVSGVQTTEIQFGLATEEIDDDGNVTTNFNDYVVVPVNEVFSLADKNIPQNNNFRVGIKLISSDQEVAQVDEFGIMFETDGDASLLNKGLV